jgi:hypothetical protein
MKITVTQAHIDRGTREFGQWPAGCRCPVAHALAERFPYARLRSYPYPALVNAGAIRIGRATFDPPPEVTAFVIAFDNDDPVQPFTFEI